MKDKIYNWLRSGKNRLFAAAVGTLLVVASCSAFGGTLYSEDNVQYSEQAAFIQLTDGSDWACLLRGVSQGEVVPDGWYPMTCNEMNSDLIWLECWVKEDSPTFMCGHPGYKD